MKAYLYVLNTLADWEIGFLTAELTSKRYFEDQNEPFDLIKVGNTKEPIRTMGGLIIRPDESVDSMEFNQGDVLILPGADTWMEAENEQVLLIAKRLVKEGIKVAAICGATLGLAKVGILNDRKHTSNDKDFLKMFCKEYTGEQNYLEQPVVCDETLITASGLAALEFTYELLKMLNVFRKETLEAWYSLHKTKQAKYFHELMNSLQI